jgi:hypothetical protein
MSGALLQPKILFSARAFGILKMGVLPVSAFNF